MNELEAKLHRTWVQLLIDNGHAEIAAISLETEFSYEYCFYNEAERICCVTFSVPLSVLSYVNKSSQIRQVMEHTIKSICLDYIIYPDDDVSFNYRVKLIEVEDGWQNIVKNLIANSQNPNQALISEKVFFKKEKNILIYNEMKFASKTEIRIAQELENHKMLFFPLPLAVRAETGNFYNDHREVDFLICQDGTWGILEVSFHQDRYEKDSEKDSWFKKSGILCIQHYTAERCWEYPRQVVDEFLSILAQHKR